LTKTTVAPAGAELRRKRLAALDLRVGRDRLEFPGEDSAL